jgi:glycosyltransferase involved in cell wall biosynthesis
MGNKAFKPKISIVLGTYNRLFLLKKCIDSVRYNNITVPYEMIVIDGGSTDGTIEWLIKQEDIITIVQHNKIRIEGKKQNKFSWGYFMNIAFNAAHAEYICMISDDCYVYPGTIMSGYEGLQNAPANVGAVAFRFRNLPIEEEYEARRTIYDTLFVNHGIYKKTVFNKLGGFEEDLYEFYKADGDYCLRMQEQGYKTIAAQETKVDHYLTEDEIRKGNIERDQMGKDREFYLKRWRKPPRPGWLRLWRLRGNKKGVK